MNIDLIFLAKYIQKNIWIQFLHFTPYIFFLKNLIMQMNVIRWLNQLSRRLLLLIQIVVRKH